MSAALNTNGSVRVQCPYCKRWRTPKNRKRPECLACVPPVPLRKYPRARVGDFFGSREVIALLNPDYTRNERVRTRCRHCGHEADGYVFNLRDARPTRCNRCPRSRTESR